MSVQIITDRQISKNNEEQMRDLFSTCFHETGYHNFPSADLRALYYVDSALVAHAAIKKRKVKIAGDMILFALLGHVCVDPNTRGNRVGHQLLEALHSSVHLPFILNCGASLKPYYSSAGYQVICDQASYQRNGEIQVDNDPVMYYQNQQQMTIAFSGHPIFLGTDF